MHFDEFHTKKNKHAFRQTHHFCFFLFFEQLYHQPKGRGSFAQKNDLEQGRNLHSLDIGNSDIKLEVKKGYFGQNNSS